MAPMGRKEVLNHSGRRSRSPAPVNQSSHSATCDTANSNNRLVGDGRFLHWGGTREGVIQLSLWFGFEGPQGVIMRESPAAAAATAGNV